MSGKATITVSGYLPAEVADGLSPRAGDLVREFEHQYRQGREPEVVIAVVGLLRVESVNHPRRVLEKPPSPALTFVAIEAVEGAEADQVRAMIARLARGREHDGAATLPYPDADDIGHALPPVTDLALPDFDNVREPERPLRPVRPDDDERGQTR